MRFLGILFTLAIGAPAASLRAEGLLPRLSPTQAEDASRIIQSFKTNPRGPFYRIQWFCKDGSVRPPSGTPCAAVGGGRQHASLSAEARRLAQWNIDVGTIYASLRFDELFDAARYHHRLKQLVMERYLEQVDRGWIYRRAYTYRGARQVEDEEKAGRAFLIRLLSDPEWLRRNYLLANQLIGVIPHGAADGRIRRIRTLATSIAAQDAQFQPLRAKIHSSPAAADAEAVKAFLNTRGPNSAVRGQLQELYSLLEKQSQPDWEERIQGMAKRAAGTMLQSAVERFAQARREGGRQAQFAAGAELSAAIFGLTTRSRDGRSNLEWLDCNALLQEGALEAPPVEQPDRRSVLRRLHRQFQYALGSGLLSARQFDALAGELGRLESGGRLPVADYAASVRYLGRALEWARATVMRDFGPVTDIYRQFEPLAAELTDHLLRSSAALPMAAQLDVLLADANRLTGLRHQLPAGIRTQNVTGLNPGVAVGRLEILDEGAAGGAMDPRAIYVIPETASDLKPVAGILTLDAGNALSHAQILAANLGIPNARVPPDLLGQLRRLRGLEFLYAVTPRGAVVLQETAALGERERQLWLKQPEQQRRRIVLDTSRLNLAEQRLRRLREVGIADSGVSIGPKAANLGQLASYFPDQVAEGFVVPFGVFAAHLDRIPPGGTETLRRQIEDAFREAERMRDAGSDAGQLRRFMQPKLAQFRKQIQTMPLLPAFEQQLRARLRQLFGPDGSYGVFVRSDTNAEDLPAFTGAGLNLTVPNVVGTGKILQALKDVWASPFSDRAYEWRAQALAGTQNVCPSVIIMRAVASEKSGVIATMNLETGNREEVTVNASEGVSAVIDGGVAESLLLKADGSVVMLQQARPTYRKTLAPEGGFRNLPPVSDDFLLSERDIGQLRELLRTIDSKYPKAIAADGSTLPWDIEFGFEKGQVRLFQIRPLARYRELSTLQALTALEDAAPAGAAVDLAEKPLS